MAANTISSYRRDLRRYVEHLACAASTICATSPRPTSATSWWRCAGAIPTPGPPLSAVSAARALIAVRGLHRFAAAEGIIDIDVARAVKPPTPSRRLPKSLALDEVLALLDGAGGDGADRRPADPAQPGAAGTAVLHRRPDLRGRRPRRRRHRHPRPVGAAARQGRQAAAGPGRPAGHRRAGCLPGARPSRPGPPRARAAPGDLPQRPRRPAVAAERLAGAAGRRRAGRDHRGGLAAHAAALVRHPPARRRRRRAGGAGTARATPR